MEAGNNGSVIKNLPVKQKTQEIQVRSLVWEDPLEEEIATHASILAWKIPWTEEPGRLQSVGSQKSDTTEWARVREDSMWYDTGQSPFIVLRSVKITDLCSVDWRGAFFLDGWSLWATNTGASVGPIVWAVWLYFWQEQQHSGPGMAEVIRLRHKNKEWQHVLHFPRSPFHSRVSNG